MISYAPFRKTLKESKETTYTLITVHKLSSTTLDKLRHDKPVNTTTLNDLCRIFDCKLSDIVEYIPSDEDQNL